eukprot:gb/GEZJ01004845.1/.p1 GENE.gb/GEZJ01004845.1/~~gb/GEZJ01004845.1/.p1  ORF type:complete len:102 (+),score=2.85 gb/GEZJ01004845.1/:654-959(+)
MTHGIVRTWQGLIENDLLWNIQPFVCANMDKKLFYGIWTPSMLPRPLSLHRQGQKAKMSIVSDFGVAPERIHERDTSESYNRVCFKFELSTLFFRMRRSGS